MAFMKLTRVSTESLVRLTRRAISDINFAVSGASTYEETGLVTGVFQEANIADCSVVHCQLDFLAWENKHQDWKSSQKIGFVRWILRTMWVGSPWGFSEKTIQPARHECHACGPLQAEKPGIQPVVGNTHGSRVMQVVSSFQKILRGSQLTSYIFQTLFFFVPNRNGQTLTGTITGLEEKIE